MYSIFNHLTRKMKLNKSKQALIFKSKPINLASSLSPALRAGVSVSKLISIESSV